LKFEFLGLKRAFACALVFNFAAATFACAQSPSPSSKTAAQNSSQAKTSAKASDEASPVECPAVPVSTIAVREINAEQLQKLIKRNGGATHPLLINFWATWCEPCREEFPDLVKIDGEFRPRGLDFFLISLDDAADIKTKVPEFLGEMKATTIPSFLLNTPEPETAINAVDATWGGSLPATFLFDANGNIVYKRFGRIKPDELRAALKKMIGNK
jgi:thiol-disulfide isomerase/thioredoxin